MVSKEQAKSILISLRNAFTGSKFCEDAMSFEMFVSEIQRYDFETLKIGVQNYIRTETSVPSLAKLYGEIDRIQRELKAMKDDEARKPKYYDPNMPTVRCKKCKDKGFTMQYTEKGYEFCAPCDCQKGRDMFPFHFMTEYEKKEAREQMIKRGQNPGRDPAPISKQESELICGRRISEDEYNARFKPGWADRHKTAI